MSPPSPPGFPPMNVSNLPPLIVRYLLDLEFIFIVINLYQVAVFLDIVFKKIVLLFRSDPVTAAS